MLHRRYHEMINEYPYIKCIFSEPPILSFRRNKNLRNWLVHSCLTKPTPNTHFTPGHTPCSSKRGKGCKLYSGISNTNSVTNKLTNKSFLHLEGNATPLTAYLLQNARSMILFMLVIAHTKVEDSTVTALMSKLNQRPANSLNTSMKVKIVR